MKLRPVIITMAGLLLWVCTFSSALAGAWTREKGDELLITTFGVHVLEDSSGAGRLEKQEYALYGEYGLFDGVTLIGRLGLQNLTESRSINLAGGSAQSVPLSQHAFGAGGIELGSRVRLMERGPWVISTQAVIGVPGAGENANNLRFGDGGGDIDLRLQVGRSIGDNGFISVAQGWRNRRGLSSDEWRLDVTTGRRLANGIEVHAQTYSVISESGGLMGEGRYQGHRAQISALLPVSRRIKVQFSVLSTVYARDLADERALIIGAWRKF